MRRAARIQSLDDKNVQQRQLFDKSVEADAGKQLCYEDLVNSLLSKAQNDKPLEDLIKAIQETDGGHNINQQLAEITGLDVMEIANLKRRLLRRLGRRLS